MTWDTGKLIGVQKFEPRTFGLRRTLYQVEQQPEFCQFPAPV
jgi:hypothetical protein